LSEWSNFFLGELGAAAALAGLLFVSVSVTQARVLALGRMADRGLEALVMLFLVLVIASLPLVPAQSLRLLAINRLAVTVIALAGLTLLWRGDGMGLYLLPPGILLILAAGANAWVLLIEINR
jgi:hypothetical protein